MQVSYEMLIAAAMRRFSLSCINAIWLAMLDQVACRVRRMRTNQIIQALHMLCTGIGCLRPFPTVAVKAP